MSDEAAIPPEQHYVAGRNLLGGFAAHFEDVAGPDCRQHTGAGDWQPCLAKCIQDVQSKAVLQLAAVIVNWRIFGILDCRNFGLREL